MYRCPTPDRRSAGFERSEYGAAARRLAAGAVENSSRTSSMIRRWLLFPRAECRRCYHATRADSCCGVTGISADQSPRNNLFRSSDWRALRLDCQAAQRSSLQRHRSKIISSHFISEFCYRFVGIFWHTLVRLETKQRKACYSLCRSSGIKSRDFRGFVDFFEFGFAESPYRYQDFSLCLLATEIAFAYWRKCDSQGISQQAPLQSHA